jgi:hypothetical protein
MAVGKVCGMLNLRSERMLVEKGGNTLIYQKRCRGILSFFVGFSGNMCEMNARGVWLLYLTLCWIGDLRIGK